jgi:hypothetical protein
MAARFREGTGKPSLNPIAQFDDECAAAQQELQLFARSSSSAKKYFRGAPFGPADGPLP